MEAGEPSMRVNFIYEMETLGITFGGVTSAVKNLEATLEGRGIRITENSKNDYDILHVHTVGQHALHRLLIDSVPKVITAHALPQQIPYLIKFGDFLVHFFSAYMRFLYNLADVVIAPSQFARKKLREIGVTKKIEVISNGVDTRQFRNYRSLRRKFRKKYGLDRRTVGCVGLPSDIKGLSTFIEVAKMLPEFDFIWTGKNVYGRFLKNFENVKRMLRNAPENFIYTGPLGDIREVYSGIDIFMFPSKIETEGLVALEAASAEKPLVVSDIESFSWLCHGKACVKAKSAGEFARAIKMLDDPDLYSRISKGGRKVAEQRNIENTSEKIVEIYKSLL